LPQRRQRICFLSFDEQVTLHLGPPLYTEDVGFLLEALQLDLECHYFAVEGFELVGLGLLGKPQRRRGLIDQVDRLVWEIAI
jgi:hypothetical protein